MRRTSYFLPTLKENPKEAQITSHRLMLRAGMISQSSSGIYSWLPLGNLVLQNIANVIRQELNQIGAQEIIIPTLQSSELWIESKRFDSYGKELLTMKDRNDRDLLYSPTAEEAVNNLVRQHIKSYKNLPCVLYQINWKFRDEIRPRFGVMRGREFLMKDAYSFDTNEHNSRQTYQKMLRAYITIFKKMGLTAVPLRAETGPIGGDLSHEFHIISETGESALYYDSKLEDIMNTPSDNINIDDILNIYASTEEMYDENDSKFASCKSLKKARGIEVGHIFYYGTKYSDALSVSLSGTNNESITPHGGCYGIGVSRLVGAIIESSHDDNGIIWPKTIAPFKVGIINIKQQHEQTSNICEEIYNKLSECSISVLYDDRSERCGIKFAEMDLIGIPIQIKIGPNSLKNNCVEIKDRSTNENCETNIENVISTVRKMLNT